MPLPRYSVMNHNNCFLYYNSYSYHSQKIHLVLLYYKLKFKYQELNMLENEQFKPWFIRINPDASLPVMRHGTRIIANTIHILEYLEIHLAKGISLLPSDFYTKISHYMKLIDSISMSTLRFWVLSIHELSVKTNIPLRIRELELGNLKNMKTILANLILRHPELEKQYAELLDKYGALINRMNDRSEIDVISARIESVLDELEHELQLTAASAVSPQCETNKRDAVLTGGESIFNGSVPSSQPVKNRSSSPNPTNGRWLFASETITAADVWVIVFLSQLDTLGLAPSYWNAVTNLRPNVARYYQRMCNLKYVQMAIPQYSSRKSFLTTIGYHKRPALYLGLGCLALASLTLGALFYIYVKKERFLEIAHKIWPKYYVV